MYTPTYWITITYGAAVVCPIAINGFSPSRGKLFRKIMPLM